MACPYNSSISDEELREYLEKYTDTDAAAGIETMINFEPFSQRNDIFNRAFWDKRVKSAKSDAFLPVTECKRLTVKAMDFIKRTLLCAMPVG